MISGKRLIQFALCFLLSITVLLSCSKQAYPVPDSNYAMSLIEKQCSFGARVPGTDAHEQCIDFLIEEMSMYADSIMTQTFMYDVSYSEDSVLFTNIFGIFNPDKKETIFLCTHFDSRPFSSVEGVPTPGANDGGSGTGLLLAIAKTLKEHPLDKRVVLMLIDGEDAGRDNHKNEWFIGSKYYSAHPLFEIPDICILVDMIGDADLNIHREGYSEIFNAPLNSKVFSIAELLGVKSFKNSVKYFIDDDHLPLNNIGYKCINIIDFDYEYWHTPDDTPDKCSAASLDDVGKVLMRVIYE